MKLHMKASITGLTIVLFISSILFAQKSKPQWAWFSAFTVQNEWRLYKGKGAVDIKGNEFSANLYLKNGILCYIIQGKINRKKIEATVIHHGTDDYPRKLVGETSESKFSDKTIRKSYLLREINSPGGLVIGITRDE
jgi:hypothetical protein